MKDLSQKAVNVYLLGSLISTAPHTSAQVDLAHGCFLVEATSTGDKREIAIDQISQQALQKVARWLDSAHVFTNKEDKPCRHAKKSVASASRRPEIRDFRFTI